MNWSFQQSKNVWVKTRILEGFAWGQKHQSYSAIIRNREVTMEALIKWVVWQPAAHQTDVKIINSWWTFTQPAAHAWAPETGLFTAPKQKNNKKKNTDTINTTNTNTTTNTIPYFHIIAILCYTFLHNIQSHIKFRESKTLLQTKHWHITQ